MINLTECCVNKCCIELAGVYYVCSDVCSLTGSHNEWWMNERQNEKEKDGERKWKIPKHTISFPPKSKWRIRVFTRASFISINFVKSTQFIYIHNGFIVYWGCRAGAISTQQWSKKTQTHTHTHLHTQDICLGFSPDEHFIVFSQFVSGSTHVPWLTRYFSPL